MKKPMKKRFKDMTKKEKARFICGKLSLVFTLLAVILMIFVVCYSSIVTPKTASASTFDTASFFQDLEVSAQRNPDFAEFYPFSLTDSYHTLFNGVPERFVGKVTKGSNEASTSSTYDFKTSTVNYQYTNGTSNKNYYFKGLTLENPFSRENIPYLYFSPNYSSTITNSGTGADWLLLLDTLADGSKVFRFIAVYATYGGTSSARENSAVWYQTSWTVEDSFVPFVDGTGTDLSWFNVTGKQIATPSSFTSYCSANSYTYDFFDCYETTSSLYSLVALFPDKNVVKRDYYGIFRIDTRYRFFDVTYADPDSNYYNSHFATLKQAFSDRYTANVSFAEKIFDATKSKYNQLYHEFSNLKSRYESLEYSSRSIRKQLIDLQENVEDLTAQLQSKTADYDTVKAQYDSLTTQYNEVSSSRDSYKAKFEAENANYNQLYGQYEDLEANRDLISAEYDDLQDTYSALVTSNQELKSAKAALDKSYADLQAAYNTLTDESRQDYSEAYNRGYDAGVSDTKAMNNVLTVAPNAVITIWNGVVAPVLRYDVFGISVGSLVAGMVALGGAFFVITRFL